MRIAMGIEYDGTAYNGWQRQRTGRGVQAVLEKALSVMANNTIEVTCAGRTDTGVHATAQVVHFDSPVERSERGWLLGANSNLPADVSVCWVRPVSDEFHARYSALARRYRYLILNRLVRPALLRERAWWVYDDLNAERMQTAANHLLGEHDFSAFRAAGCQARTANRNVTEINIARQSDWISLTISANAFLQHMVRNIAGTLVAVGRGEQSPDWTADVLRSRDRKQAAVAAPAQGLTLIGVTYPPEFGVPESPTLDLLPGL